MGTAALRQGGERAQPHALEAGAGLRSGCEARSEYGEPLAPEQPDNRTLGSSILFTSRLYRRHMPFTPPSWAHSIAKQQLVHRHIASCEYGYLWLEWGGDRMGVWDYIENSGEFPDSSFWAMDWFGTMPGKRGRRLPGDHVLTGLPAIFPTSMATRSSCSSRSAAMRDRRSSIASWCVLKDAFF